MVFLVQAIGVTGRLTSMPDSYGIFAGSFAMVSTRVPKMAIVQFVDPPFFLLPVVQSSNGTPVVGKGDNEESRAAV